MLVDELRNRVPVGGGDVTVEIKAAVLAAMEVGRAVCAASSADPGDAGA